ncbi:MAG: hypothetical protein ACE1Y4_03235, partial [Lysobacterales bacterium]
WNDTFSPFRTSPAFHRSIPRKAIDGPMIVRPGQTSRSIQWGVIAPAFPAENSTADVVFRNDW